MTALRVLGVFTAVAVLFTGQVWLDYGYARAPISWSRALLLSLLDWYLWAALTPLIVTLTRRVPLKRGRLLRALVVHVPAGLLLAVVKIPATEMLATLVTGVTRQPTSFLKPYIYLFTYWAIVAATTVVQQQREARLRELRASQLEADLTRAELDVLRMRLNPHFLFNTLNGISALMGENVETADQMLTRLGDLLRLTLERGDQQEVSLKEEVDFVRKYIEIQQLRFGDRLTVSIDLPHETLSLAVPSLSLQPLVENALEHGIERLPGPGRIALTARRTDATLEIEICDDGPGPGAAVRAGTGLETTRLRLQHLYGDAGRLVLEPARPRGAIARLTLPARETVPAAPAATRSR